MQYPQVLVIGGANTRDSYGKYFYQVGMHQYASFGIGRNWYDKQFWIDLDNELSKKGILFSAIMFDTGSEKWLSQIPFEDTLIYVVGIFDKYLTEHGIILCPNDYGVIDAINEYNDERYGYDSEFYDSRYGNDPILIIRYILRIKYKYVINYCLINSNIFLYLAEVILIIYFHIGIYILLQKN